MEPFRAFGLLVEHLDSWWSLWTPGIAFGLLRSLWILGRAFGTWWSLCTPSGTSRLLVEPLDSLWSLWAPGGAFGLIVEPLDSGGAFGLLMEHRASATALQHTRLRAPFSLHPKLPQPSLFLPERLQGPIS